MEIPHGKFGNDSRFLEKQKSSGYRINRFFRSIFDVKVGKTSTGIIPRVLERPIASFVVVTAASDISGKAILSPSDGEFTLTPEQSVASTLYHELWHILIKLKTNSQLPGEEIFVQELEKLRLQLIQEGKIEEFLPIEFIKPQGSIDRFRRGRPKKLEVVNFFGPRIMEA